MLSVIIVVFREMIEISLIISLILSTVSDNIPKKTIMCRGIFIGIVGALLFACSLEGLTHMFEDTGQEIFNAIISFMSAILIGWTVVHMRNNVANLKSQVTVRSQQTDDLDHNYSSLIALIALTIFREAAEIILLSYGIYSAHVVSKLAMFNGMLIGVTLGIFAAFMLYQGLLKLPYKYFFKITSWILILLAANMGAGVATNLTAAGIIEDSKMVWNFNSIIPANNFLNNILSYVLGFMKHPSLGEIMLYILTILIIVAYDKIHLKNTYLKNA